MRTGTQTDSEQELSESDNEQHKTDTTEQSDAIVPPNTEHRGVTEPQNDITRRRSTRKCNEPVRFRDYSESMSETSDTSKFYKIRRILGQRQGQNAIEYFVQFKGNQLKMQFGFPFMI